MSLILCCGVVLHAISMADKLLKLKHLFFAKLTLNSTSFVVKTGISYKTTNLNEFKVSVKALYYSL